MENLVPLSLAQNSKPLAPSPRSSTIKIIIFCSLDLEALFHERETCIVSLFFFNTAGSFNTAASTSISCKTRIGHIIYWFVRTCLPSTHTAHTPTRSPSRENPWCSTQFNPRLQIEHGQMHSMTGGTTTALRSRISGRLVFLFTYYRLLSPVLEVSPITCFVGLVPPIAMGKLLSASLQWIAHAL